MTIWFEDSGLSTKFEFVLKLRDFSNDWLNACLQELEVVMEMCKFVNIKAQMSFNF